MTRPDEIADLIADVFRVRHDWEDQLGFDEDFQRFGERPALKAALNDLQRELSLDYPPAAVAEEPFAAQPAPLPQSFGRYTIQTDKGTILIRSHVHGVEELILRIRETVKQFEVQLTKNRPPSTAGNTKLCCRGKKLMD